MIFLYTETGIATSVQRVNFLMNERFVSEVFMHLDTGLSVCSLDRHVNVAAPECGV